MLLKRRIEDLVQGHIAEDPAFTPRSNPPGKKHFSVISYLQKQAGLQLDVMVRPA
jgi:hypothetical protein